MIALVTGASGFIGSHLVDALRQAGHEVRPLVRPLPPDEEFRRAPIWEGVTHLFHLAARTRAPSADAYREANVGFTERLLRAAEARPAPPHVVFISSVAACGPAPSREAPCTEDTTPAPIERYGASKLQAERRVQSSACPSTIIRLPAVYGPRDRDFLTVFRQLQRPLHWRATPGWHAFTLTHVHDVVAALLAVVQQNADTNSSRSLYHLGGFDCSWDEFYATVLHELQTRSIGVPLPSPLLTVGGMAGGLWAQLTDRTPLASPDKIALGRAPWWLVDGNRFTAATGWSPRITLEEGIRETARWYREQRWL